MMRELRTVETANRKVIAAIDRVQAMTDEHLRSLERQNRLLVGLNWFLLAMIPLTIAAGLVLGQIVAG